MFLGCMLPRPSLAHGPASGRLLAPVVPGPPLSSRGRHPSACLFFLGWEGGVGGGGVFGSLMSYLLAHADRQVASN